MNFWLFLLPSIILAQALGVGLAWSVDVISWKWRQSNELVIALNLINSVLLISFILLTEPISPLWLLKISIGVLLWLSVVASVQCHQLNTVWRVAFFATLMQLWCFVWLTVFSIPGLLIFSMFFSLWFGLWWFVSALLTYALLSLFRPTIYGAWNTWRGSFTKK